MLAESKSCRVWFSCLPISLLLIVVLAVCSTPTTGYNFAQAGFIPVELVFFNENSIPSLAVSRQGPGSSDFSVSTKLPFWKSCVDKMLGQYTHTHRDMYCALCLPFRVQFCSPQHCTNFSHVSTVSLQNSCMALALQLVLDNVLGVDSGWSVVTLPLCFR